MRKIIDNFEEYFLALLLPAMCILVFTNTVGRYTGTFSLGWAEETARYLMVWLVFFGISAAAKRNAHFAVGVLFMITPLKAHIPIRCFILIMVLIFTVSATVLGFQYSDRLMSMGQASPALGIPMWFMYSAIPVGCGLMSIRSIQCFLQELKASRKADYDDSPKFNPDGPDIG